MRREVVFTREASTLLEATRLMRRAGVGFMPVCDEAGAFVGTLTERDIIVRACANDLALAKTRVGAVMSRGAPCCYEDHDVSAAERLMAKHRKLRLAVVDHRQRPVGVIRAADIDRSRRAPAAAAGERG
jgi:CBS domain-containing protein